MKSWLIVESFENWKVDQKANFTSFGLPDRKRRLAEAIRKDDLLFAYVSTGKSAFTDVRRAIADGVAPLRKGGDYDRPFDFAVKTEPFITLAEAQWLRVADLRPLLSFGAKEGWQQFFRTSIRALEDADARVLLEQFKRRSNTGVEGS